MLVAVSVRIEDNIKAVHILCCKIDYGHRNYIIDIITHYVDVEMAMFMHCLFDFQLQNSL